jgi:transposase
MKEYEIFAQGLGLSTPWEVKDIAFRENKEDRELHITIQCQRGTKFEFMEELCSIYDHQNRTWRHVNFFSHKCYIHCEVPRIKTKAGNVMLVDVPWAEPGSSFVLLFEMYVLSMIRGGMSVSGIGKLVGENYGVIHRIVKRHVMQAIGLQHLEPVQQMSVDETSSQKGHKYLTIISDRQRKKVVGIGEGKDRESLQSAIEEMEFRGASREKVKSVTMDMSRPYISVITDQMSQAKIIFDRFHLTYNLNKEIDRIRKRESKEYSELRKTKYIWLKNNENLTAEQRYKLEQIQGKYLHIGTAYRYKELFREVMDNAKIDTRLKPLNQWIKAVENEKIPELTRFVNMLKSHWYGIKTYFKEAATNAYAERVNLKIQEIKRIAKGYRNMFNYKMMIYFHLGGLNINTHYKW